jgi:hypothetical protein
MKKIENMFLPMLENGQLMQKFRSDNVHKSFVV